MKKFVSILLVLCLISGLPSTSVAAKKKTAKRRKAAATAVTTRSGDLLGVMLSTNEPRNQTNADIIRKVLNKYYGSYGNGKMLIAKLDSYGTLEYEFADVWDQHSRKSYLDGSDKLNKNIASYKATLKKACTMSYNSQKDTLTFLDSDGKVVDTYSVAKGLNLSSFAEFAGNLSTNGMFNGKNTATFPYVLVE